MDVTCNNFINCPLADSGGVETINDLESFRADGCPAKAGGRCAAKQTEGARTRGLHKWLPLAGGGLGIIALVGSLVWAFQSGRINLPSFDQGAKPLESNKDADNADSPLETAMRLGALSPDAALDRVREYSSMADYDAAIKLAKPHSEKPGPLQGEFALELAKSYASKKDVDNAVRSLETAMRLGTISSIDAMVDPSFSDINTELKFVSAIADN